MPRPFAVAQLPAAEFEFVIQRILDGDTDREVSAAYKDKFKKRLSKSALNRWREAAGNELADRYRLARYQAKQLLEDVGEEGAGSFQAVMRNIEDRLLTATREVISSDPVKMLRIRQEEEKRRLKERELELKREQLAFQRDKAEREANLQKDRFGIAAETWKYILFWMSQKDSRAADILTANSEPLLRDLEAHLQNQSS